MSTDIDRFGPNAKAVRAIIERMGTLTEGELFAFDGAVGTAWGAREDGEWDPVRDAPWEAARAAVSEAVEAASREPYLKAATDDAWDAASDEAAAWAPWNAIACAVMAVVADDLVADTGPFTPAHSGLLLAPWRIVTGK